MRLAIADPPYFGRAAWYGGTAGRHAGSNGYRVTDSHPEADRWNDPVTHLDLLATLNGFDGWALALSHDSLALYLAAPDRPWTNTIRTAVWVKPNAMPSASRVQNRYEPLLYRIPDTRRGGSPRVTDVLTHPHEPGRGFVGAKPRAWTRWVLDLLGYQDGDQVVDLFPGSGAVAAEVAQQVLPLPHPSDNDTPSRLLDPP